MSNESASNECDYDPIPEAVYDADAVRRYQIEDHQVSDAVIFTNTGSEHDAEATAFSHAIAWIKRSLESEDEASVIVTSCSPDGLVDIEQQWLRSPAKQRGAGVDTLMGIGLQCFPDPVALVELARSRTGDPSIPHANPLAAARRLAPELFGDPNSMQVRPPASRGTQA